MTMGFPLCDQARHRLPGELFGEIPGVPAGAVEDLVIGREVFDHRPPGDAQAGGDGPFARRQQGAHDEYEHETPCRGGERIPEWFEPGFEDLRNRIARSGWILFRQFCFRVH